MTQPLITGGCVAPHTMAMLACMFLLPEVEVASTQTGALAFNPRPIEITWNLPASKPDPLALGTARTWGRLCDTLGLPCLYRLAIAHHDWLRSRQPQSTMSRIACGLTPLFPRVDGIVRAFESLAKLVSQPIRSSAGARLMGAHIARIIGAQVLAAHGLEANKLRRLARHSGDNPSLCW